MVFVFIGIRSLFLFGAFCAHDHETVNHTDRVHSKSWPSKVMCIGKIQCFIDSFLFVGRVDPRLSNHGANDCQDCVQRNVICGHRWRVIGIRVYHDGDEVCNSSDGSERPSNASKGMMAKIPSSRSSRDFFEDTFWVMGSGGVYPEPSCLSRHLFAGRRAAWRGR